MFNIILKNIVYFIFRYFSYDHRYTLLGIEFESPIKNEHLPKKIKNRQIDKRQNQKIDKKMTQN